MRVRLVRSNELLFRDVGDRKTQVVIYSGHSHVGGNVTASLRQSADSEGPKVMAFAVCNGAQTLFKVVNRHPETDFLTTRDISYFSHGLVLALGLLDGIAARHTYRQIRDGLRFAAFERPDNITIPEEQVYAAHLDLNGNGQPDVVGGVVERYFNVHDDHAADGKTDLRARAVDADPDAIDGHKVMDAVQFARTIAHTHQNYQGHFHASPIRGFDLHAWRSGGWYAGSVEDPAVRVVEERGADGKARQVVQVNRCYKHQSAYAIGALVCWEMVRRYTEMTGRAFDADAKAQAIILAGEMVYELYGTREEARAIFTALGERAGIRGLSADFVLDAVEAEEHGMGSATQLAKLRKQYAIA
jgi:hypothetical protein